MSNAENDKLKETFLETLDRGITCPYCGERNQDDPVLLCCHEVHSDESYVDKEGDRLFEEDIEELFQTWLAQRAEP